MLPDIRAVFAAFVAAIGLLMIAFGAVATFRVAQESRVGSLQADLAQRGQAAPPQTGQRVAVIETPGPHIAPPPPLPRRRNEDRAGRRRSRGAIPRRAARLAPETEAAPIAIAAPREAAIVPVAEAPVGGPLAEPAPARSEADRAAAKERARRKARRRQKGARQARIARQRKAAAARRAARRATADRKSGAAGRFGSNPGFGNSGIRKHAREAMGVRPNVLAVRHPAREARRRQRR